MSPAYRRLRVPVDGGELTVGVWGEGGPTVLALHGVTASHLSWAPVAQRFGGTLAAPDLRGRGGSAELPGPWGMAAHARDVVAVADALGWQAPVVVGHSMGGFAAVVLADLYADRVGRLVLVDGGPPLAPPVEGPPEEQLAAMVGPAVDRLAMRFADREAYRDFWRGHPALREWTPELAAYVDYDLVGTEPELRSRVSAESVRADSIDMITGDALPSAWRRLRRPARFLGAERGMLDQPTPLFPDTAPIAARMPVDIVPDTNHYTILFGAPGAAAVAAALAAAPDA